MTLRSAISDRKGRRGLRRVSFTGIPAVVLLALLLAGPVFGAEPEAESSTGKDAASGAITTEAPADGDMPADAIDAGGTASEAVIAEGLAAGAGHAGAAEAGDAPSGEETAGALVAGDMPAGGTENADAADAQPAGGTENGDAAAEDTAAAHVHGIRDFSIIEGMIPDPMAGISWDETIGTVLCDTTKIDWNELGTHELTYTIAAMDQSISFESIQVTVHENLEYYIYGMEGEKKVTVDSSFDPMEGIHYDDKIASVTADTSTLDLTKAGEYAVSYTLTSVDGQTQTAVRRVRVTAAGADGWDNSDNVGNYSVVVDLGVWRLTAYMDTPHDQGPYVGQTASGAPLIPGRTVAVSAATCGRLGLNFGDKLLIDGHVYTLEDHGGSAMNNQDWADIFVDNPIDEFSERFNHYTKVYLLR